MSDSLLSLLKSPTKTSAIIFIVDIPTKSVLLFDDRMRGMTGYLFSDSTCELIIKSKSIENLTKETGITVSEQNPLCSDIVEINKDNQDVEWRYIIIVKNFKVPNTSETDGLPPGSKWFNKNQIIPGKIRCKQERDFLIGFMRTL